MLVKLVEVGNPTLCLKGPPQCFHLHALVVICNQREWRTAQE